MPTHNRRAFVARAIGYFLRQDYSCRELIVMDDGIDRVADLIPADPRVRYIELAQQHTLGTVRNLACAAASGELIVHWDDDDWAAPWRVSFQVQQLLDQQADICGLDQMLYYDITTGRAWRYHYPGGYGIWVSGSTLCYTRAFWQTNPFPDRGVGEDNGFIWSKRPKRIVVIDDSAFYVGIIHAGNTSPKQIGHRWWQPQPVSAVQDLMGADWASYVEGI
jgi:glycosyltransferase involved in cell wall biosynthesis